MRNAWNPNPNSALPETAMKLFLSLAACLIISLSFINRPASAKPRSIDPEAVLKIAAASGKPTLLEFGATWCASCARVEPLIKALRNDKQISSRLNIITVDVEKSPALAAKYRIQSLPVLVLLDESGKEVKRHFGIIEQDKLLKMLKSSFRSF